MSPPVTPDQTSAVQASEPGHEPVQPGLVVTQPEQINTPVQSVPGGEQSATSPETSTASNPGILDTLRKTARNATAVTPASAFVPSKFVPAVAVTLGMALALAANILWANVDKIRSWKLLDFIRDFLGENTLQRIDEYEAKKRKITLGLAEKTFIGLTHAEILVAVAGALLIAIASLIAIRGSFAVDTILLYVVTAGVAVTVHESGHWYAAHHLNVLTEVKFWEIGTLIMFFTGWFGGSVFAQPHRTVQEERDDPDHRIEGKISLAGPIAGISLGILMVPFLFAGGSITVIASTLLMMTLLIAVYHLMPFGPMDGKAILHWNKKVLIVTLVPLLVIYYYLFLL